MSNVTQDSHNSGDSKRRRSRGGKNRNNSNNNSSSENRQGGERRSGENRGGQSQNRRQGGGNRSEEFRPQAPRPARVYSAPKLSFWQKILKAIGLYKEPARPERKPENGNPSPGIRVPKSNTRVARSHEGPPPEKEARPERQLRPERGDRPERQPRERNRGGNRDSVESPRVYVGNLSYDVSEEDLKELFKGVGGVRNVEIVYNRSTHRSKGYGFLEMLNMDDAIRSVEVLNDQFFMGRKLTVSGAKSKGHDEREEAEDRPERESRPVVVASANPQGIVPAAVATPAATVEPTIETIVEQVAQVPEDLESRYGFETKADAEKA